MEKLAKNIESLNNHREFYVNPSLRSLNERYDQLENDINDFKYEFYENFSTVNHFKNKNGTMETHYRLISKVDDFKNSVKNDIDLIHQRINFLIDNLKKDIEKIKNKKSVFKKILDFFLNSNGYPKN